MDGVPHELRKAFEILERAAVNGERCPITANDGYADTHPAAAAFRRGAMRKLAALGHIAVEISSRNWRRVTILTGLHAGKSTAPNPTPHARTYQTIDKNGRRLNGQSVGTQRVEPSPPRLLVPYAGSARTGR